MQRRILVTGSAGFIGSNLIKTLQTFDDTEVVEYHHNSKETLSEVCKNIDFAIHCAGVNRPIDESDFVSGNTDLTLELIKALELNGLKIPILLTSSIQAKQQNPYGSSKRAAEKLVFEYAKKNTVSCYVFRLPNIFGKWSRPNYNSVVATFCNNISRNLPIQISDPNNQLTLAYIDDVVDEFTKVVINQPKKKVGEFCEVSKTFKISLGELADILQGFYESRKSLLQPDLSSNIMRSLYATYTSYLPHEDFAYTLTKHEDKRGYLSEFIKLGGYGQIFVSTTKPGITRGDHWHHTKVEKFFVLYGTATISFRHLITNETISYRVDGKDMKVVDIPTGYVHNIKNIGKTDLVTLFWASEIFDQDHPDTYYEVV